MTNSSTEQKTQPQTDHTIGCISDCLKILGDKWTALILDRLFVQPLRFSELQQQLGINPRTLSQRLSRLEERGIIQRTLLKNKPSACSVYITTPMGNDLHPILQKMSEWGDKYRLECN